MRISFSRLFALVLFFILGISITPICYASGRIVVKGRLSNNPFVTPNSTYVVKGVVDLGGKELQIPPSCIIKFKRNGKLVNGALKGSDTKLKNPRIGSVGVLMKGTWIIPIIKDEYFDSDYLSDTQILDNITQLQSDTVDNVVCLEKPVYNIVLEEKHTRGLRLSSNTVLNCNSKLIVLGNNLTNYAVIGISNKRNVKIIGGEIVGDVGRHTYIDGSSSQWGFGIQIFQSEHIAVSDIKISKCIGDGIYIGGGGGKYIGDFSEASKNLIIEKVVANDNRRQGISITYGYDVLIQDCVFSNTGKTESVEPGCGLDIEPNMKQSVGKVTIRQCSFLDNNKTRDVSVGGYRVEGEKCNVGGILFENCTVKGMLCLHAGGETVRNCTIGTLALYLREMPREKILVEQCDIKGGNGITIRTVSKNFDANNKPVYYLKNCSISVDVINYKAIVSTINHAGNELGELLFENCIINLPEISKEYDLVQDGCGFVFKFEGCDINSHGRILHNRGFSFSRCTLNCSYVDLSPSRNACVVEDCTINASDSQRSIVLSPTSIQSQKPLYVVKRNSIVGGVEKSIITKGINKARYDISGNEHSRNGVK